MTTYRVTWTIDLHADTPQDAAAQALDIQRDPASTATVFEVSAHTAGPGQAYEIDFTPEEEVTVLDPDDPTGSPAYDGPAAAARRHLMLGTYPTDEDGVTLIVGTDTVAVLRRH